MSGFEEDKEKIDTLLLQKPTPIELFLMGMMNKTPISSKEPKGNNAVFCTARKEMQLISE